MHQQVVPGAVIPHTSVRAGPLARPLCSDAEMFLVATVINVAENAGVPPIVVVVIIVTILAWPRLR